MLAPPFGLPALRLQERKRAWKAEEDEAQAFAAKAGVSIPILPKSAEDAQAAAAVAFRQQRRTCSTAHVRG